MNLTLNLEEWHQPLIFQLRMLSLSPANQSALTIKDVETQLDLLLKEIWQVSKMQSTALQRVVECLQQSTLWTSYRQEITFYVWMMSMEALSVILEGSHQRNKTSKLPLLTLVILSPWKRALKKTLSLSGLRLQLILPLRLLILLLWLKFVKRRRHSLPLTTLSSPLISR